jgi:thiol-disulfide isomerase/thioredoxin
MLKKIAMGLIVAAGLGFAEPASLPAISLPDLAGKTHTSAEFAGKPVLIDFWATWCATCKETVPELLKVKAKYAAKGLQLVGISIDKIEAAKVEKGAKKLDINYLVLHDQKSSLQPIFGYSGVPSLYLFDKDGKLVLALQGYDPSQEAKLLAALDKL